MKRAFAYRLCVFVIALASLATPTVASDDRLGLFVNVGRSKVSASYYGGQVGARVDEEYDAVVRGGLGLVGELSLSDKLALRVSPGLQLKGCGWDSGPP